MGERIGFEALGRGVQAEADSVGGDFASAVKSLVAWFGAPGWADSLWSVVGERGDEGLSVTVSLLERDAYVAPSFLGAPELSDEQVAAQVDAASQSEIAAAVVDADVPVDGSPADVASGAPVEGAGVASGATGAEPAADAPADLVDAPADDSAE